MASIAMMNVLILILDGFVTLFPTLGPLLGVDGTADFLAHGLDFLEVGVDLFLAAGSTQDLGLELEREVFQDGGSGIVHFLVAHIVIYVSLYQKVSFCLRFRVKPGMTMEIRDSRSGRE